jgi:hypothetical protein
VVAPDEGAGGVSAIFGYGMRIEDMATSGPQSMSCGVGTSMIAVVPSVLSG